HLAELDEEIPRRDQPEMARHRQRIALQRLGMSSQRLLPYVRPSRCHRRASGCLEPVEELNIRSSPRKRMDAKLRACPAGHARACPAHPASSKKLFAKMDGLPGQARQ